MQRKRRKDNKRKTNHNSTNGIRWTSPHRASITSLLSNTISTNRTRSSRTMIPYSRITGWFHIILNIIPSIAFLVLLFGLFSLLNPSPSSSFLSTLSFLPFVSSSNNSNLAYATVETKGDSTASMTLDTSDVMVDTTPGTYAYVSKDISLSINNAESYSLTITAPAILGRDDGNGNGNNNSNSDSNSDGNIDPSSQATSWGYAYGASGTNPSTMSYMDFNGNAQTLESSNSNITSLTSNKTLAIRAGFSEDNVAGHYTADVVLSLAATPKIITYTLTLDNNGGTGGTTSKTCETYDSSCSISLSDVVVPNRTGYIFLGWNDSSSATTAQYTTDGAGGTSNTISMTGDKTIWSVWKVDGPFNGITNMQQMTSSICNSAKENDTAQLKDTRDNKTYWVTKLKDGKCWMTQNLDYDDPSSTKVSAPTSWTWVSASRYYEYYDPGNYYYNGPNNEHSQGDSCNASSGFSSCSQFSKTGNAHYHIGNYYSWKSATGNICPSGWKLPTKGGTDSYFNLITKYGFTTQYGAQNSVVAGSYAIYGEPLYFTYSGSIGWIDALGKGRLDNAGTDGNYWTSTPNAYYDDCADGFWFSNVIDTTSMYGYLHFYGMTVRCVSQ